MSTAETDRLRGRLQVRIQDGTEVTLSREVTPPREAPLRAGVQNGKRSGDWTTYLTLLGGGAFGNHLEWIIGAIRQALNACRECLLEWPLDVAVVSHGQPDPGAGRLVYYWNGGT